MERSRSSRADRLSLVLLCFLAAFIPSACGQCTYPSDLTGLWYTSHENSGQLTWTSTNVTAFDYETTGTTFSNLMYECFLSDGTYYVSKTTTTITLFGADFYVYTCWRFSRASADKYIYWQSVTEESQVSNARVKVFTTAVSITLTSEICDDTSYDNHEYSVLIRNGTHTSATVMCPDPLLVTGRYTISDTSTSYCDDNSWLDVCSDTSVVSANYTLCNTNIFYSASGTLYCVHRNVFSSSDSSTYYVTLFNSDATTDQSTTYVFTCVVVTSSSNVVYMTQYPGECLNSTYMNATYISEATGFSTVLQPNSTCGQEVPTTSSELNLALILGLTFGLLLLIIILIIVGYLCYDKKFSKMKTSRSNSKVVPDTLPNTAMSHGDKNYRMMFTPAPPRSAVPGGRHIDYYDGGRAGSLASLRPTVSQLANIRTPTPVISSSKEGQPGEENGLITIHDETQVQGAKKADLGAKSDIASVTEKETGQKPGNVPEEAVHEKTIGEMPVDKEGQSTTSVSDHTTLSNESKEESLNIDRKPRSYTSVTQPDDKSSVPDHTDRRVKTASVTRRTPQTPKAKKTASRNSQDESTPTPKRAWSSGSRKINTPLPSPNPEKKDFDIDSILDFDSKRIGEPDGAESGVMVDIEGSLPVFSESGDLTPEPTRITPRGQINPPRRPKPTPRGMAL